MRIALGIEYDGTRYQGWQKLPNQLTIQQEVENALSKVANSTIQIYCAGRTDAGVHATGQVVHFDTTANRVLNAWIRGGNSYLPKDISIQWAKEVPDSFHARFSATARTYRYSILVGQSHPALLRSRTLLEFQALDIQAMQTAANFLLGEHDFSAFRSSECQARTPFRCIKKIDFSQQNSWLHPYPLIILEIQANAFLHHMVRNIMGSLLLVGKNLRSPEWLHEVLLAKDRRLAGPTAPARGLCLVQVEFDHIYSS